jgi:hypothetical protein
MYVLNKSPLLLQIFNKQDIILVQYSGKLYELSDFLSAFESDKKLILTLKN